jgi:hypothetical protein
MNAETEFYDGGIGSIIEKDFLEKIIVLAKLSEREALAIAKCVMGDERKSHVAKELGILPDTVTKAIERAIKKLQLAFIENRNKLAGKDIGLIIRESKAGVEERIKQEKQKPAEEWVNEDKYGTKHWYRGNLLHREGAPAVIQRNGGKAWFYYGIRHREDGPAIEYADGSKEWWLHDQRHRQIGYAVEHANGHKEKWLYNNKIYEKTTKPTQLTN